MTGPRFDPVQSGGVASPEAQVDAAPPPYLSVIIPCFNERVRLPTTLVATVAYLEREHSRFEILVVDDGSSDGTAAWAKAQAREDGRIRTVDYPDNRGKGYAVKAGMAAARGDYVLFMDADNATRIEEIAKLLPHVEAGGYDIAIGSRSRPESKLTRTQGGIRLALAKLYGFLTRSLALSGIRDTQCGFKLFTREAAKQVFEELHSASPIFDIEMLMITAKKRIPVTEIGVEWNHDPESRIQYDLKRSIAIFIELLRIKWNHRALLPLRALTAPRRGSRGR
jgi:dolichyl-phosphate beta-glucosyltransferase